VKNNAKHRRVSSFHNPVQIHFGKGSLEKLPATLADRPCALITTLGMVRRGVVDRLKDLCGNKILAVFSEIQPNPTVAFTNAAAKYLEESPAEVILAVGGGSVLDTAKGVAAQRHPGLPLHWLSTHLRENEAFPSPFSPTPIIAVPTTAGTGSEVTMWGTIWDERTGKKYSLSHEALYPEAAIVDPELTLTVPRDTTVATALDALSHAMEAIWNRNTNPISDLLAANAISTVSSNLRDVLKSPTDLAIRGELHYASMIAGLAFSNTRTAIAHSISYPLTGQLGIPHGIACSFTLPEIMRVNGRDNGERLDHIVRALGCTNLADSVGLIQGFLTDVGVPEHIHRHFPTKAEIYEFIGNFITPGRADNNIVPLTEADAVEIFRKSARQMLEFRL